MKNEENKYKSFSRGNGLWAPVAFPRMRVHEEERQPPQQYVKDCGVEYKTLVSQVKIFWQPTQAIDPQAWGHETRLGNRPKGNVSTMGEAGTDCPIPRVKNTSKFQNAIFIWMFQIIVHNRK